VTQLLPLPPPLFHVGFTGTRYGMRSKQRAAIADVICDSDLRYAGRRCVAHHGDCLGADAEFHSYVTSIAWRTVGHIPVDDTHRAFCDFDEVRDPLPHMKRNKAIVTEATFMIATSYEMTEQERGGTWATIRMARKAKKPLVIVFPDGSIDGSLWPWRRILTP
jgi:hypothetical protein